jgi:uncharacterized tellurite resistance protein B-like protein
MMDKMLKESVAALFCHVIKMDDKDINVERPLFRRFMKQDFPSMSDEEACTLLDEVMEKEYNIDTQISILANGLHNEIYTKMSVLKQLNHIIVKSKLVDSDYDLFDKVKSAFFP